jgi:hypothetical protein
LYLEIYSSPPFGVISSSARYLATIFSSSATQERESSILQNNSEREHREMLTASCKHAENFSNSSLHAFSFTSLYDAAMHLPYAEACSAHVLVACKANRRSELVLEAAVGMTGVFIMVTVLACVVFYPVVQPRRDESTGKLLLHHVGTTRLSAATRRIAKYI